MLKGGVYRWWQKKNTCEEDRADFGPFGTHLFVKMMFPTFWCRKKYKRYQRNNINKQRDEFPIDLEDQGPIFESTYAKKRAFMRMSNLLERLKAKKWKLRVTLSSKVTPYHQDRWAVQAVCPVEVPGASYGAWGICEKLIQNNPNFSIWTGTLNWRFLVWEDWFIQLFMLSKLMRWEGYKDLGTPCALK